MKHNTRILCLQPQIHWLQREAEIERKRESEEKIWCNKKQLAKSSPTKL